jgi:hypothetical protein
MGQRHWVGGFASRQLGGDAQRLRAEPGPDHAGVEDHAMSEAQPKICIYPGCRRSAVPPHLLGGPQPSFCDLEAHNALTAHQERERLKGEQSPQAL